MSRLRLDWRGPWSLLESSTASLFGSSVAPECGFYVWCVPTDHGRLAYYVGETGTGFARRHRGHLESYSTGSYSIHRATALLAGTMESAYAGYVYSKRRRAERLPEFKRRRSELDRELRACLECLEVFTAQAKLTQRERRRVETAILDTILANGAHVLGFQNENWSRHPRLSSEQPISVECSTPLPLVRMVEQFEA